MLTTLLLLLSLAQDSAPIPFLWTIQGLDGSGTIVVTVTPTLFGLESGLDVKTIALDPLPTPNDSNPGLIHPREGEPTAEFGLRARFTPPRRGFHLRVTLSDGSIYKINIYRKAPQNEPTFYQVQPLRRTL